MHLLIIAGFWPTQANSISGIFVVQQVDALVKLGHRVTILLGHTIGRPSSPHLSVTDLGLPEDQVTLDSYPIWRLPEKVSGLPGGIALNTRLAGTALSRKINRISASDAPFEGCVIHGLRYSALSLPTWRHLIGGKVLAVCHGVDPFLERPRNKKNSLSLFQKMASDCESVVLVGQPLKAHAQALGLPLNCLTVVPNGTELPPCDKVSDRQRPLEATRRVISVSNLVALKGIDLNLRALARISEWQPELKWEYTIVGDGPLRHKLEALSSELGLADRVRFLGRLPYDRAMEEVSAADVFSLPSWGEAFGIVYLEAMARLRPVIGCLNNGAADIFKDGREGLLVPPHDVGALAAALERLLSTPDQCQTMGQLGRASAEHFSWEANGRTFVQLLESPLKGGFVA